MTRPARVGIAEFNHYIPYMHSLIRITDVTGNTHLHLTFY